MSATAANPICLVWRDLYESCQTGAQDVEPWAGAHLHVAARVLLEWEKHIASLLTPAQRRLLAEVREWSESWPFTRNGKFRQAVEALAAHGLVTYTVEPDEREGGPLWYVVRPIQGVLPPLRDSPRLPPAPLP